MLVKEGVIMPRQKEREREKNQKEERQTDGVNKWLPGTMEWRKMDRSRVRKGFRTNANSYVFAILDDKNTLQWTAMMVCTVL